MAAYTLFSFFFFLGTPESKGLADDEGWRSNLQGLRRTELAGSEGKILSINNVDFPDLRAFIGQSSRYSRRDLFALSSSSTCNQKISNTTIPIEGAEISEGIMI